MKKLVIILLIGHIISSVNAQQKRIYIAPDCHTDFYWTAGEIEYSSAFLDMLDYYMDLNEQTSEEPYNLQSKWNCDGSYWVYTYEKNRDKAQFNRLLNQIREGKITVPLNTLNSVHGAAPTEAAIRDMYYAGALERKYDLDLNLAFNMEDHIMPLGLASIWAAAGAKYSWHGVCHCATKVKNLYSRPFEFYWYTGLDGRKILMKWQSLTGDKTFNEGYSNQFPGGYAEAWKPIKSVQYFKSIMSDSVKYRYDIASAFGKGWDNLKVTSDEFVEVAREYSDSNYQVIVSNEIDFFEDFEKNYGTELPVLTASYGGTEWGKGIASLAEVSASIKRSMEKLRAAEAMYTLVSLNDASFCKDLDELRERAWIACGLYFEHDWTADSPNLSKTERASWTRGIAHELSTYVDTLYERSKKRLGQTLSQPSKGDFFYVFNPLSWQRTDYADLPYSGDHAITVIDSETGKPVAFQRITHKNHYYLRVLASNVPSLGFKNYEIRNTRNAKGFKDAASFENEIIENQVYRIKFTSDGSITSLVHKSSGIEYIQAQNGLYANDLGRNDTSSTALKMINVGPVSVSLFSASSEPVKHHSTITLFSYNERIEIENSITQTISAEPVAYSYSFNMNEPHIWHEEVGAILNARSVSQGGHYAETQSRLDWLTLNHFVSVSDKDKSVILSNKDAYFMKVGNSELHTLDHHTPQVHILAGGQVDADNNLGFENQGGDTLITNSLALMVGDNKVNAGVSMRFALEHQNPLVSGPIAPNTDQSNTLESLFTISDPNILVWAVKPAEEGIANGIILRLWNMNEEDTEFSIRSSLPIKKCLYTTHIETDLEETQVNDGYAIAKIRRNGLQTYRLFLTK